MWKIQFPWIAEPITPPLWVTSLYVDTSDNILKSKDDAWTVTSYAWASLPVVDTVSIVQWSTDSTKQMRFEVDWLTTATTRVLTVQDKDYTIWDMNNSDNLSWLASAATARTNLWVAIWSDVQAYDADLDTWATKTAPSWTVVWTTDAQTLTNKTIDDPKIDYSINTQSWTSYTFGFSDQTKIVEMNNASANTVTIPTNASVALPVWTTITVIQIGVWLTTVQGDTWVTVNWVSAWSKATGAQYEWLALYKRGTNEWVIINK